MMVKVLLFLTTLLAFTATYASDLSEMKDRYRPKETVACALIGIEKQIPEIKKHGGMHPIIGFQLYFKLNAITERPIFSFFLNEFDEISPQGYMSYGTGSEGVSLISSAKINPKSSEYQIYSDFALSLNPEDPNELSPVAISRKIAQRDYVVLQVKLIQKGTNSILGDFVCEKIPDGEIVDLEKYLELVNKYLENKQKCQRSGWKDLC